jgi:hypothetical protein
MIYTHVLNRGGRGIQSPSRQLIFAWAPLHWAVVAGDRPVPFKGRQLSKAFGPDLESSAGAYVSPIRRRSLLSWGGFYDTWLSHNSPSLLGGEAASARQPSREATLSRGPLYAILDDFDVLKETT